MAGVQARQLVRHEHNLISGGQAMTPAETLSLLKEKDVKFVDLRFTDTRGKEQHVTVPSHVIDEGFF